MHLRSRAKWLVGRAVGEPACRHSTIIFFKNFDEFFFLLIQVTTCGKCEQHIMITYICFVSCIPCFLGVLNGKKKECPQFFVNCYIFMSFMSIYIEL